MHFNGYIMKEVYVKQPLSFENKQFQNHGVSSLMPCIVSSRLLEHDMTGLVNFSLIMVFSWVK